MNEKYIPNPEDDSYIDYFEEKYGDGSINSSKSNRKNNQDSQRDFMPMDGKYTRNLKEYEYNRNIKKYTK